ncbi:hypothetical protein WS75_15305 [Burkholderia sp. FL-7-2-10-S1-D7]|nr:hypothetical protein WS75_15305 [Burkholderia sp. FL-7-2-10-S1-D7]
MKITLLSTNLPFLEILPCRHAIETHKIPGDLTSTAQINFTILSIIEIRNIIQFSFIDHRSIQSNFLEYGRIAVQSISTNR